MREQPAQARLEPTGHQVVDVLVDRGYHPDTIVARAGIPLRLVFRRDDADVCSERVVFSSPHLDRRLAVSGITMIDLPPQSPGEIRFTCGMGRYRGRIALVATRAPSLLTRIRQWASRLASPLGTALVLGLVSLPVIALVGVLVLDVIGALVVVGAAVVAWVAGCLWAFGRSTQAT